MGRALTRRAAIGGAALWLSGCAGGVYASGRRAPPGRVLIMPAHITLGERRLGGEFRLRRDWSEAVRLSVLDAARKAVARRRRTPVMLTREDDQDLAWALARLHRPVAESLLGYDAALTGGSPVRSRVRPGLGGRGRSLAIRHEAPTGLFISITGAYPEGWQYAAETILRETLGVAYDAAPRRGIVSLVELETGAVFWSSARRDRAIRDPARAAGHVAALIAKAGFRRAVAA
ncbi:MAG: hypothetical protein ACLFQ5_04800 [Oceanicaulis sp.]